VEEQSDLIELQTARKTRQANGEESSRLASK
jgi:hypothetical protein